MGILNINAIETYRQHIQVSAHTTEAGLCVVGILNIHVADIFRGRAVCLNIFDSKYGR